MKRKKFKIPKVSSVINSSVKIVGELTFDGGLHLEGKIKGNVYGKKDSASLIIIGKNGSIEGNLEADCVVLDGTVIGDVVSKERVELGENANVTGTVFYKLLEMSMGAAVNGRLVHVEEKFEEEEILNNVNFSEDFSDLNN